MTFRSKPDGSRSPIRPKKAVSLTDMGTARRAWDKAQIVRLRTLESPLLWKNFVKTHEKLNPDFDFDQLVDRTLEPDEALKDITS